MPTSVQTCPFDVLLAIFLEVDEPAAFAATCKSFRAIATSNGAKVKWLNYRWYPCEVVWHALTRRRLANEALLRVSGAPRRLGPTQSREPS